MGISIKDISILHFLKTEHFLSKSHNIIEIGAQQLSQCILNNKELLADFFKLYGKDGSDFHMQSGQLSRGLWEYLGYQYAAIDVDGSPNSIPLDLNYDSLPSHFHGAFDLVTNLGTSEHIANQLNVFKVIHELTNSNGGIMIHHLPAQGMMNHGLINYNMKFFWMLARSNGYKWVYSDYSFSDSFFELPDNIVDSVFKFNPGIATRKKKFQIVDQSLQVVLQKVHHIDYVPPVDIPDITNISNEKLRKNYWTVFDQTCFSRSKPRSLVRKLLSYIRKKSGGS